MDMHVHTSLGGDSDIDPEELIDLARAAGLNGVCVMEHHSYSRSKPLEALALQMRFFLVRGLEYHGEEGHLLIFGFPGDPGNLPRGLPMQYVINRVHSQGGVAIPAHPFQKGLVGGLLGSRVSDLQGLVALETINGSLSTNENLLAQQAARDLGIHGIGGSDAHGPSVLGRAFTCFPRPIQTPADLLDALRQGGYYPELDPGHPMNRIKT
jgi:predicted metal-dependent phosphoesterase TrpH